MDKQPAHQRESSQVFLTARDFASRYGKERGNYHVWLARRTEADARFPKVIFIGSRKFYSLAEVETYERALLAERA